MKLIIVCTLLLASLQATRLADFLKNNEGTFAQTHQMYLYGDLADVVRSEYYNTNTNQAVEKFTFLNKNTLMTQDQYIDYGRGVAFVVSNDNECHKFTFGGYELMKEAEAFDKYSVYVGERGPGMQLWFLEDPRWGHSMYYYYNAETDSIDKYQVVAEQGSGTSLTAMTNVEAIPEDQWNFTVPNICKTALKSTHEVEPLSFFKPFFPQV